MEKYESLFNKLQIFEKLYDVMRIVDPLGKKVLEEKENNLLKPSSTCYSFWEKNNLCNNCISIRAFNEDDSFFKLEYKDDDVFMITAVPVIVEESRLIIELIKKISNNLVLEIQNQNGDVKALAMIDYLNEVVVKDSLTGLFNRRYIDERLPIELLNASLKNETLSIIFADLDFFKNINDTYGHSIGDIVLKKFSKELDRHIQRDEYWAARFGGEEFLICLPNTAGDTAKNIAEKIRKNIEKKLFIINNKQISLTCSFGVHEICNNDKCTTVEGVINLLDEHLYKAKELGRNRVE